MNIYIRFEDRYGIFDLFQYCKKLPDVDALQGYKVTDNLIIRNGVTILSSFSLNEVDYDIIEANNIDLILNVHDLDSLDGKDNEILQYASLETRVFKSKKELEERGFNVELRYLPVIFAAETVMLYIIYNTLLDPTTLVHKDNTKRLHYLLVDRELVRKQLYNIIPLEKFKVKHVRKYIKFFAVLNKLREELSKQRGNQLLLELLIEELEATVVKCLTLTELKKFLDSYNSLFSSALEHPLEYITIGDESVCIADLSSLSNEIYLLKKDLQLKKEIE